MKACFFLLRYMMTWLLFWQQALQSFAAVDWHQVRPAFRAHQGKPA